MDKPRILIVEDQGVTAEHLKLCLTGFGYETECIVSTAEEAIERAEQLQPDLILMDIMLHGAMDGIEAAEKIHSLQDTPIVYLTAYSDRQVLERAKLTEPFGYLLKPFKAEELRTTIEMALYKHRVHRKVYEGLEKTVRERTAELSEANEALKVKISELTAINWVAREAAASFSSEWVIEAAHEMILSVLDPDLVVFYRRVGNRLIHQGIGSTSPELAHDPPTEKEVGECLCGLAAESGKPIYCLDIRNDARCTLSECKEAGITSFAALPLAHEGSIMGVIGVASLHERDFSKQAGFMETLCNQVAVALENSDLFERIRGYASELEKEVSERKQAQQALMESERKYRSLFDDSIDGIYMTSREGDLLDANRSFLDMVGYDRDEMVGLDVRKVYANPLDREKFQARIEEAGFVKDYAIHLLTKEGKQVECLITASVKKNADGIVAGYEGIIRDVTELKRSQRDLNIMARAVDSSISGIGITDLQGKLIYVNDSLVRMWGYDNKEEMVGRNLPEFWDGDRVFETIRQLRSTGVAIGEDTGKRKDGTTFTADFAANMLADGDGNPAYMVGSFVDISERKRLKEQLFQAQKMEAMGTLAGGIAHDFNNILHTMLGYTELAEQRIGQDARARGLLHEVVTAGKRARDLVRQILTFSRDTEQEKRPMDAGPIVEETVKFLRATLPATIEIRQETENDLALILADPTQIHQLIMNLCTNAVDAMRAQGGTLTIVLSNEQIDEELVTDKFRLGPGLYLGITVRDTGEGMTADTMYRMFDPYYSKKEMGHGTGLGLAVVHGIVREQGGAIVAFSEPGSGSAFHVYLPTVLPTIDITRFEPVQVPEGNERVLLVDDEVPIARMSQHILQSLGYRVEIRTSSLDALDLIKAKPGEFDVLITDLAMPSMDGLDLAGEVLRIRPDMPIVLATGFSDQATIEKARALGIRESVMKPILRNEVGAAIRRVMEP